MTNQLRSGKIIPRNGATDVAAFKFYLDEVKCRLSGRYGAGNGACAGGRSNVPLERIPTQYDAWLPQPEKHRI